MTGRPPTTALRIIEALKANATKGIGVADLAVYSSCSPKVVKQTVCRLRMGGHVIGSSRVNERQVRYFYGSEKNLATRFIAPRPTPTREIIYQALVAAGSRGLSGAEVKALCSSVHAAKNACEELKHSGRMVGRRWVGAESRRYFLTQEDMAAAYLADRAMFKPKVKEKPEPKVKAHKPKHVVIRPAKHKPQEHQKYKVKASKNGPTRGLAFHAQDATNPNNVQPVVCPGANVERFRPTRVEPYFSALTPGSYAAGDTWAARVYG